MIELLYSLYNNKSTRPQQLAFSIFWDGDKGEKSSIHHFDKDGITNDKVDHNMNISFNISTFVNSAYEMIDSNCRVFSFYTHSNIWFIRHAGKILPFHNIFSKIKYHIDIICLESCYSATIENCLELIDKTSYLIASEHSHSKCSIINNISIPSIVAFSNSKNFSCKMLSLIISNSFIKKINSNSHHEEKMLDLTCDISIIDINIFKQLYPIIFQLNINKRPYNDYIKSKVYPKKNNSDLGYDLYSIISLCNSSPQKTQILSLYSSLVIFYEQSKWLIAKKYSSRAHGLSWSPAPYDSDHGWSYKYSNAFLYKNHLTIY
jgi:hypothetical protein